MNHDEYLGRLVDERRFRPFLRDIMGPASEYGIEYSGEGHSNETLFVTWGSREIVVRRPPPGETADTAHDVLREYRVINALTESQVPVPTTIARCSDHTVIGSDFFVMERVPGETLRDNEPGRFADRTARQVIGEKLVDCLTTIHSVDPSDVGLDDFGHPDGYLDRQIERWTKQLEWAATRTDREFDVLDRVAAWLTENAPTDHPHTLVHGDYKLDNVMYGKRREPELVAVLDWELSTLGDPRSDLGWLLAFWHDDPDRERVVPELIPPYLTEPGYPSRRALVERYERRTGLTFEQPRFYVTLALYKLAALGEMFYARHLTGDSDDPLYPVMEQRVPALCARAAELIDGTSPL